jgi:hypothetical protein
MEQSGNAETEFSVLRSDAGIYTPFFTKAMTSNPLLFAQVFQHITQETLLTILVLSQVQDVSVPVIPKQTVRLIV